MNRKITIKEICDLNRESLSINNTPEIIQYLDTSSITRNIISSIQLLDKRINLFPSRAQRKVRNKTIIYSTVRPEQEHFGILQCPDENVIVSTGFLTLDVADEEIDPKFLYYSLTRKELTNYLNTIATNNVSAYPSLNPDDIGNLELEVPRKKIVQQQIADVLSVLDAKIEINTRINAELEAKAKILYDYWFVQFDFPNEQGKTYKSSGGKMVWHDKLKREIPDGWNVQSLYKNDLTEIILPGVIYFEDYKIYLSTASINEDSIEDLMQQITYNDREVRANMQPVVNSIWFAKMKDSKKTLYFGEYSQFYLDKYILSTGMVGIACKSSEYLEYIWNIINSNQFETKKNLLSHGSTQQAVNNDDIKFITFIVPNKRHIKEFHEKTKFIYNLKYLNEIQNIQLSALRDWLLPMLMNGQVKVK